MAGLIGDAQLEVDSLSRDGDVIIVGVSVAIFLGGHPQLTGPGENCASEVSEWLAANTKEDLRARELIPRKLNSVVD